MDHFRHFNQLLSTQNVNVARFARNVEWDFFCDFQTLWWRMILEVVIKKNVLFIRVQARNESYVEMHHNEWLLLPEFDFMLGLLLAPSNLLVRFEDATWWIPTPCWRPPQSQTSSIIALLLHQPTLLHSNADITTVFENHRKSLIQYCERSELRLHFGWTKVH